MITQSRAAASLAVVPLLRFGEQRHNSSLARKVRAIWWWLHMHTFETRFDIAAVYPNAAQTIASYARIQAAMPTEKDAKQSREMRLALRILTTVTLRELWRRRL